MIVAGFMGRKTIKRFGLKGHTAIANTSNFFANLVWAYDTSERGTFASQAVMALGHRKRDGLEAMIARLGTSSHAATANGKAETWGRGEVSGMLANFKSATWIVCPMIYSRAYTMGTRGARTFYGAPMVVAAAVAVLAQACVLCLPGTKAFNAECGTKSNPLAHNRYKSHNPQI